MILRWIVEAENSEGEVRVFRSVQEFYKFLGYKAKPKSPYFKVGLTRRGWTIKSMTQAERLRGLDLGKSTVIHTKDGDISIRDFAMQKGVGYYSAVKYIAKIRKGKSPRLGCGHGNPVTPFRAGAKEYANGREASSATGVSRSYLSLMRSEAMKAGENHFYAKGIRFDF